MTLFSTVWKSQGSDHLLTTIDADMAGLLPEDQAALSQVVIQVKKAPGKTQTCREKVDSPISKWSKGLLGWQRSSKTLKFNEGGWKENRQAPGNPSCKKAGDQCPLPIERNQHGVCFADGLG